MTNLWCCILFVVLTIKNVGVAVTQTNVSYLDPTTAWQNFKTSKTTSHRDLLFALFQYNFLNLNVKTRYI
jgi:hypothetical protein